MVPLGLYIAITIGNIGTIFSSYIYDIGVIVVVPVVVKLSVVVVVILFGSIISLSLVLSVNDDGIDPSILIPTDHNPTQPLPGTCAILFFGLPRW